MKKVSKLTLAIGSTLLCLSAAQASNQPTTFLGPTLRGGYTAPLTDMTAWSVAGEAGVKNYRVGLTLGVKLAPEQRLKVSGEWLWQRINYSFYSGDTEQWVNQGAVGARYEYDFAGYMWYPQFDINGYYSHADSKNLSTVNGTFIMPNGLPNSFSDARRIAGSNAGGGSPGLSIAPWWGGRIGVDANYDSVTYDKHTAPNEDAKGWGGTIWLRQMLTDVVSVNLSAADRKPFNAYEGTLAWNDVQYYGRWTLGLFGDYVDGKNTLPNTWNLGLSADYFMDPLAAPSMKGENLKGEVPGPMVDRFLDWTADPAVYMPQVLAIPDGKVTIPDPACKPGAPTTVGTLPNTTALIGGSVGTIATAGAFSPSSGLTYTITQSGSSTSPSIVINPSTGVITGTAGAGGIDTITVYASDRCGTTSASFNILVRDVGGIIIK